MRHLKKGFEVLTEELIITYEKKKTRHGHKRLNYTSAEIQKYLANKTLTRVGCHFQISFIMRENAIKKL